MRNRREFVKVLTGAGGGFFAANVATAAADRSRLVTILNGRRPPARHLGIVGDFYIDDVKHTIYGPKRSSGWGRPTDLIGPHGQRGARGYSILHGSGPPAARLGVDDDFYIDTQSTQLYGPKEGGVWGSPISLTGNIGVIDGGSL